MNDLVEFFSQPPDAPFGAILLGQVMITYFFFLADRWRRTHKNQEAQKTRVFTVSPLAPLAPAQGDMWSDLAGDATYYVFDQGVWKPL